MNPGENFFGSSVTQAKEQTFESKRENFMVDIRRSERMNIINRKRFMHRRENDIAQVNHDPYSYLKNEPNGQAIIDMIKATLQEPVSVQEIDQYVEMIRSDDRVGKIRGAIKLRMVLSIKQDTPLQAVIDTNVVQDLVRIAKKESNEEAYLRIEASWCLTNLATGTSLQVQSLIEKGVADLFVEILTENNLSLIEQAVWGIGNIAGDCIGFRDMLLSKKAIFRSEPSSQLFSSNSMISFLCSIELPSGLPVSTSKSLRTLLLVESITAITSGETEIFFLFNCESFDL